MRTQPAHRVEVLQAAARVVRLHSLDSACMGNVAGSLLRLCKRGHLSPVFLLSSTVDVWAVVPSQGQHAVRIPAARPKRSASDSIWQASSRVGASTQSCGNLHSFRGLLAGDA